MSYYVELAKREGFVEPLTVRGIVEQAIEAPTHAKLRTASAVLVSKRLTPNLDDESRVTIEDLLGIVTAERELLWAAR